MKGITPETLHKLENGEKCARASEGTCAGERTVEHAILWGGRQLKTHWSEIILCDRHHSTRNWQDQGDLNKEMNEWLALEQATEDELREYSKVVDLVHRRSYLRSKYAQDNPHRTTAEHE